MNDFENDASMYVQKMLDFYKVDSLTKLSEIINISVPSISNWRKYNYTKAIKTKCKELGIYREIFDVESDPRSFQIGASSDNSTFFQVAGNNNPKGSGNDLTPQEETLLDYFRKAPEEFKKQILIFALGGKP